MNRTRNRFLRGMTLMEVLASIFVISIGLLGVLAVIPFGAFQVSKGRNAEHVANMLAAAGQDVQIMESAYIEMWKPPTTNPIVHEINSDGSVKIYERNESDADSNNHIRNFNCSRFYLIDPFDSSASDTFNEMDPKCFYKIGHNLEKREVWKEFMTGQDDLVYTVHKDKRTDFSGQENHVVSSGRYTWFMTFAPPSSTDTNDDLIAPNMIDVRNLASNEVSVDLLGCYNRVPGDSSSEREVEISNSGYTKTLHGAQMTLVGTAEKLDLSKTKYIFVVLDSGAASHQFQYNGYWCKIAYAPKSLNDGSNDQKTIVVVNDMLPESLPAGDRKAIIIDGIMYHKSPEAPLTLF